MSEKQSLYIVGVDVDMAKYVDQTIKQATLTILEHLDDIDKQAVTMWCDEDHPNVILIKTMTKAMRDEIEKMIYAEIKGDGM